MQRSILLTTLCSSLSLLCLPQAGRAGDYTTTTSQGSGQNWNAAIWKLNGSGTAVAPTAGNTYQCIDNGTAFGNNTGNTRLRNPATAGVQTFPGDSLTLNTNSEIRMKQNGAILNFPGVNGNPGLILNGGVLNMGDDGNFPVTGTIRVDSQSYICPGNNGGGGLTTNPRSVDIQGQLSGTGALVVFEGRTNVAQRISGGSNTFSGQWIVKAGSLLGTGTNSLGTNSITVDPNYVLPVPPFSSTAPVVDVPGPAVFEVNYDLNSAGMLTLNSGGMIRLHQNCCFSAVMIDGTSLSPGIHFYADLNANYPANFPDGGSGSITIQPFGTPPALAPTITTQPMPQVLYAGRTAMFTVAATGHPPLTYHWRKNGANLTDSGNVTGSATSTLTITNLSTADAAIYDVVVSASGMPATSSPAALQVVSPSGEAYETAVLANNPVAFYQFNETTDPAVSAYAFDYVGGFVGTYGTGVQNGNSLYNIAGPRAVAGFPGFASGNAAAQFATGTGTSRVTVSPWNLNTNTVTITAWVNPNGPQTGYEGLVFCRGNNTVAGLNYSGGQDAAGNYTLGYTWNNEWETYSWDSGLVATPGQWSFVALVVTPANATIHVMNTNGLVSATHAYAHVPQAFTGTTLIGDDSNDGGNGSRVFNGIIDDVAVFNTALSRSQLLALYSAASGGAAYPPSIAAQPVSTNLYAGQTAQFSVAGGGSDTLTYQWKVGVTGSGVYANLTDGGRISGSATPTLVIANVTAADAADYVVTIANGLGSTNSAPATLTVMQTYSAEAVTMSTQEPGGSDWDTGSYWSDGNPASVSATEYPGSTYELQAGARMRSPQNPRTATFPGSVLTVSGSGVWVLNPAATDPTSEIRFKQPNPGRVIFPKLVMNGGQLDTGNDGVVQVSGEIDILTNAPFNNDSGNDRGYLIDAWLTGKGSIEYHGYNQSGFMPGYVNNLNIAGASNTFSGTWNVVTGTLLGTAPNALGTNDITVGANAALETTYDLNNTNSGLYLNGRMYLHQNDTFRRVLINGTPLAPGTYTFAQLSSTYSNNFPAAWTPQTGAASYTNGSGSITVLGFVPPTFTVQPVSRTNYVGETVSLTAALGGALPMHFQWQAGAIGSGVYTNLVDTGNLLGSGTSNLTLTSVALGNSADFVLVVTNQGGTVTSSVATLLVQPLGPPLNITMSVVEAIGSDWDTGTNWSDGLPASRSAIGNPGSTYELLPGALLRTPTTITNAVFPGNVLTVDGDGVWGNGSTTIAEIRFKQPAPVGTVTFKKLVMNGGQLDNGISGLVIIGGEMDILANTPIYGDGTDERPYQIDAWLTGAGTIEYHGYNQAAFMPNYASDLNITGTSNTFSGKWNVVIGVLLGSGGNSLGTNDITVGVNGALETSYDIYNPHGTLYLDGQMFLHQNDKFHSVVIAGTPLPVGTYTFAQLNAQYPAAFPATWTQQTGSAVSTGSGSITVLGDVTPPPQVTLQVTRSGSTLQLNWQQGVLLEASQLPGPWTTNNSPPPFTITPSGPQKFYRVLVQ